MSDTGFIRPVLKSFNEDCKQLSLNKESKKLKTQNYLFVHMDNCNQIFDKDWSVSEVKINNHYLLENCTTNAYIYTHESCIRFQPSDTVVTCQRNMYVTGNNVN
jgi:hypothetical protein